MKSKSYQLLLTARNPISHHDPSVGKTGNILKFNRNKQFIRREPSDTPVYRHLIDNICQMHLMTKSISFLVDRLTASEWMAVTFIKTLLDVHNTGDGEGLLSGMDRYKFLEKRTQVTAISSYTLHGLWSALTKSLGLTMHSAKRDEKVTQLWTLPPSVQYSMLTAMSKQHRAICSLARLWHTKMKHQTEEYCIKTKIPYVPEELSTASFADDQFAVPEEYIIIEVPAISVNSLRHQMLREPAYVHLFGALGIEPKARGEGCASEHAEGMFYNGGNIVKGAVEPSTAFYLAGEIRKHYPTLDLLGGTTKMFDIGESHVRMSAWIVCKENAGNLPVELHDTAQARTSVFEMLDDVTRTRHKGNAGVGQMIYTYETLVAGTQIYVEITTTPYIKPIEESALATAIKFYEENVAVVGGQSARGNGHVSVEWLGENRLGLPDVYEEYLAENKEALLAGIIDGTLCSGAVVV